MSSYDPDHRARSADAGGGWIIGIIVVVLLALGIWWWAGAGSGPEAVGAHLTAPPTTNGSARHWPIRCPRRRRPERRS